MRLRELHLLAFGPFAGARLDLSARALHVVWGQNEAGKSTALRAVFGLLFGIEKNTRDAYAHAMRDLRIGATVEDDRGGVLSIVRRKGNVNTLLDPDGNAIDEAALRAMLGGVDESLYRSMFGLDHQSLREGAQGLLLGKGAVGESLFGASLGAEVHEALRSLEKEAESIFAPQASTRPLNAALKAHADAARQLRAHAESTAVSDQQRGLDEALAEREAVDRERHEVAAELARVRRARQVRPLRARRALVAARRTALGEVPAIPESASKEREEATRDGREARAEAARLEAEIAELERRRAALVVPEDLLARGDAIAALQERVGAYKKAAQELPRARGELARIELQAHAISARLGRPLAELGRSPVDTATQAQLRRLALQPAALAERLRRAERDVAEKEAALAETAAAEPGEDAPIDAAALREALARAHARGDVEERVRAASAEVEKLASDARARAAALRLRADDLDALRAIAVPSADTVERFARDLAAQERAAAAIAEQRTALGRRGGEIAKELDALAREGDVPTEEALSAARARRAETWRALRGGWSETTADEHEARTAAADEIADRLRREAHRTARLAGLLAERAAIARDDERARAADDACAAERGRIAEAWAQAWRASGVEPLPPAEMRAWVDKHAALLEVLERSRAAIAEHARLAAEKSALQSAVAAALRAAGEDAGVDDFGHLMARASARVRALEERARKREDRARRAESLAAELRAARAARDEARAEVLAWQKEWARAVVGIGLPAEASPEQASAVLDDRIELATRVDELRLAERRVAELAAEVSAFEAQVAEVQREREEPAEHAAAGLVRRWQDARAAHEERTRIEAQLDERRGALRERAARAEDARARLDALLAAARAKDVAELEQAESRAREARELDAQLRAIDEQLADLGDAHPAAATAEDADVDALDARIEELAERHAELDRRHGALQRTIGALEHGLEELRKQSMQAEAAEAAQGALARARALAERWVRVRLAAVVLAREIERYREKHQGPILARASALFERLTLGSFRALRVAFDERDVPVIRCVRGAPGASPPELDVEALSDGTRDQLYLALRLATIERWSESGTAVPFVVDDVLVHFDDARAGAALEALAEVASRVQVVLFTHHERVALLARALGERAEVHDLTLAPRAGKDEPAREAERS